MSPTAIAFAPPSSPAGPGTIPSSTRGLRPHCSVASSSAASRGPTARSRVTFEIVRPVGIAPLAATALVVRPGRSVELLEGELVDAEGRELIRARAWRLRTDAIELTPPPEPPPASPPPPEDGRASPFFATGASVGYHTAIEWSFVAGAFRELGPATVWLRTRVALVTGEEPSPLARVLIAADSGNGVSATLDFRRPAL